MDGWVFIALYYLLKDYKNYFTMLYHKFADTSFIIFALNGATSIKIRYRQNAFKEKPLTSETVELGAWGEYFIINVIIYRASEHKGGRLTFIKIPGPMEK